MVLYSQNSTKNLVEIKYITYINNDIPLERESKLYIDKNLNKAVYVTDYQTEKVIDNSKLKALAKEGVNLFEVKRFFNFKYVFTNLNDNKLNVIDYLYNKSVNYNEVIPNFNWELLNETKVINNYICNKAKTTFRGREYNVWYAKDIPVSYGPWKFSGLPGLILEVYDNKKKYSIAASEIIFNSENEMVQIPKTDLNLSLREFINKYDELYNHNNWSSPGVKISQDEYVRPEIELIYEWEQQP